MSYARPSPIWSSPTSSRLHPPRSHTPTRPGQSALYSRTAEKKRSRKPLYRISYEYALCPGPNGPDGRDLTKP